MKKIHLPIWLIIILVIVFILRIPSFFEPFSYGDEMIYLTLGQGVRQNLVLYRDIHDNKPPLLYFMAALAGNVFWFKVILAVWSIATIILFWKLVQILFRKKRKLQKISTGVFAILTTIPFLEGNIANAENFMLGPIIAAFLILLSQKPNFKNLFISGLLFSMATLFKVPAAFDLPVIIFFWLIISRVKRKELVKIGKKTLYLAMGFLLPVLLSLIWYYSRGGLSEYLTAAFLQNVGYLSSWRPESIQQSFLIRNGPLLCRAGIVAFGLFALYLKRKKLSQAFLLASIWLLFGLFAVTLSERPYPHYLLQVVPSISILLGILIGGRKLEQTLTVIPLFLALLVPVYYKYYYYSSFNYYNRFLHLATGQISKEEYFARFDGNVLRNYKISEFIVKSSKPNEKIFVWGDSPPIYALSRRLAPIKYIADYHINDFSNKKWVMAGLEKNKPSLIVILPAAPDFDELASLLKTNYLLIATIDGAEIWHLLNPNIILH